MPRFLLSQVLLYIEFKVLLHCNILTDVNLGYCPGTANPLFFEPSGLSQVLGYGKYTSQTQPNFINIKCHINDYMFRPFLFN